MYKTCDSGGQSNNKRPTGQNTRKTRPSLSPLKLSLSIGCQCARLRHGGQRNFHPPIHPLSCRRLVSKASDGIAKWKHNMATIFQLHKKNRAAIIAIRRALKERNNRENNALMECRKWIASCTEGSNGRLSRSIKRPACSYERLQGSSGRDKNS